MNPGELELQEDEVIQFYSEPVAVEVCVAEDRSSWGSGELFVTTQRIHFRAAGIQHDLPYAQVAMHGLSSDPSNFGAPCVLVQLTTDSDEAENPKWLLMPADLSHRKAYSVQVIYDSIAECLELQPAAAESEESSGEEWDPAVFEDAEFDPSETPEEPH